MIRFLASTLLTTLANAVGLLVAAALLPGFTLNLWGLIVATLLFTFIEVIAGPFITKESEKHIPALTGGVALVTTVVGLIITDIFVDGMSIKGFGTWAVATLIVWLAAVLAGLVLPMFMFKKIMKPDTDDSKK